jgi:ABC-type polar amino acid transport system ATPase subunit
MSQITMTPADAMITLENVNKWYGQFHVLKDINLKVKQGERIVLCGPSGSGNPQPFAVLTTLKNISKDALWLMVSS